jgi:hypothetical protein
MRQGQPDSGQADPGQREPMSVVAEPILTRRTQAITHPPR